MVSDYRYWGSNIWVKIATWVAIIIQQNLRPGKRKDKRLGDFRRGRHPPNMTGELYS